MACKRPPVRIRYSPLFYSFSFLFLLVFRYLSAFYALFVLFLSLSFFFFLVICLSYVYLKKSKSKHWFHHLPFKLILEVPIIIFLFTIQINWFYSENKSSKTPSLNKKVPGKWNYQEPYILQKEYPFSLELLYFKSLVIITHINLNKVHPLC